MDDDKAMRQVASSLGDIDRNFMLEPLTQKELSIIVMHYEEEILRPDLDPRIKEVYSEAVRILKKHVIFH